MIQFLHPRPGLWHTEDKRVSIEKKLLEQPPYLAGQVLYELTVDGSSVGYAKTIKAAREKLWNWLLSGASKNVIISGWDD